MKTTDGYRTDNTRYPAQSDEDPDWAGTIRNLIDLARQAGKAFDFDKAREYLETAEEIWVSKGLPESFLDLRFELLREKGKSFASQGRLDEAITQYQEILKYCRDAGQLSVRSETFTQIGQLLSKQGDHDRALGYLQRAIGAYRRLGDHAGMCRANRNLGVIYIELGEFEEAEATYEEAIELAEEIGDRMLYGDLINNMGAIMNMRGNWEQALELYDESLEIYAAHDEIRKSAYTRVNVGITLTEKSMHSEALTYFQIAHETAVHVGDASLTLIADINLADIYLKLGQIAEAEDHCLRAEKYLVDSKLTNSHLVETRSLIGKIARHQGDDESALVAFDGALETSRQLGTRYLDADILMERGILRRTSGQHLEALTDLEESYRIYRSLKAEGKREKIERVIYSIERLYLDVFNSMAQQVDRKDKYTKGHTDRVASLALLLAKQLGLSTTMQKSIVAGALLHDIGKTCIGDDVLKKPGRLTKEEFQQIQKHPAIGVDLLRGKEFPWDVKPLILHHHEKLDGTGYPLGVKGEDIPLGARIICIADVFDALTSDRVYRKAFDIEKALSIMEEESGTTFDPVLFKCFIGMIRRGTADPVINSRTRDDELFSIWSQCMDSDTPEDAETAPPEPIPSHQEAQ